MKALVMTAALLLASFGPSSPRAIAAPSSISGLWDAVIVANGAEVPFRFEIVSTGPDAQGFFFEGDRKIGSTLSLIHI